MSVTRDDASLTACSALETLGLSTASAMARPATTPKGPRRTPPITAPLSFASSRSFSAFFSFLSLSFWDCRADFSLDSSWDSCRFTSLYSCCNTFTFSCNLAKLCFVWSRRSPVDFSCTTTLRKSFSSSLLILFIAESAKQKASWALFTSPRRPGIIRWAAVTLISRASGAESRIRTKFSSDVRPAQKCGATNSFTLSTASDEK